MYHPRGPHRLAHDTQQVESYHSSTPNLRQARSLMLTVQTRTCWFRLSYLRAVWPNQMNNGKSRDSHALLPGRAAVLAIFECMAEPAAGRAVGTSPARSRATSIERSQREQGPGRPRPASRSPVPPRATRPHTSMPHGTFVVLLVAAAGETCIIPPRHGDFPCLC